MLDRKWNKKTFDLEFHTRFKSKFFFFFFFLFSFWFDSFLIFYDVIIILLVMKKQKNLFNFARIRMANMIKQVIMKIWRNMSMNQKHQLEMKKREPISIVFSFCFFVLTSKYRNNDV